MVALLHALHPFYIHELVVHCSIRKEQFWLGRTMSCNTTECIWCCRKQFSSVLQRPSTLG